jgi:plasmid stability protein
MWEHGGSHLAQLVVRNIDEDVLRRLRERATRSGRSIEEEVREILRAASQEDVLAAEAPLGSRIARRFAGLGLTPFEEIATGLRSATASRPQTASEVLLRASREER